MVLVAAFGLAGCQEEKKAVAPPPPPEVEVAEVIQKDVPVYQEWVASMDGMVNATILAQVQGYLIKQNYKEGDFVKKGALLFEIDPRPFQAAVDEARAALAKQQAVLQTAQANLKRILPLAAANAVSQRDKDNAIGSVQSAEAQVLASQAQVRKAELDLGFTKIASPIDGIAGAAKAQMGDLVGTPQARDADHGVHREPHQGLRAHQRARVPAGGREVQAGTKAGRREDDLRPDPGRRQHLAARRGRFPLPTARWSPRPAPSGWPSCSPTPSNILRPGQYAKVRALMKTEKGAMLVPQRAVGELQGSYQVAVVEADNTVQHPRGQGRRAHREPVGHPGRAEARRAGGGRGDPESGQRGQGDAQAVTRRSHRRRLGCASEHAFDFFCGSGFPAAIIEAETPKSLSRNKCEPSRRRFRVIARSHFVKPKG